MSERFANLQLVANKLGCVRGGRTVFSDVSFRAARGELLAVTGRNGAGKSSLLRQIAGLVAIASGSLSLEGGDPDRLLAEQAHFVGHLDAVKPTLSVAENLIFWRRFYDRPGRQVEDALGQLGLGDLPTLPAAYLSQGQKRRLNLARLLVSRRPLWLLDEPMAGLDAAAQEIVAQLIHAHLQEGGIVVATTHGSLGVSAASTVELGA